MGFSHLEKMQTFLYVFFRIDSSLSTDEENSSAFGFHYITLHPHTPSPPLFSLFSFVEIYTISNASFIEEKRSSIRVDGFLLIICLVTSHHGMTFVIISRSSRSQLPSFLLLILTS